jgi:hypothetical protein
LAASGRILGDAKSPFALALGGFVYTPTATDAWTGDGYVYGEPQLLLGGKWSRLSYSAYVG